MSEKLSISYEVEQKIAKDVSIATGTYYPKRGKFNISFNELSKETQRAIYDLIEEDHRELVVNTTSLLDMYETLRKEQVSFDAFDFTDSFFNGAGLDAYLLHYVDIRHKHNERNLHVHSKTRPNQTIRITYALDPHFVEAKERLGEYIDPMQQFFISRKLLPESLVLALSKFLTKKDDEFFIDLTSPKNERLYAHSLINDDHGARFLLEKASKVLSNPQSGQPNRDEKQRWIEEFGSDHLQRAFRMGYHCQRQYVTERAMKEFPDFTLDFSEEAKLKERPFPSVEALDIEEALRKKDATLDVRVEWMQKPEQPCEVLVIRDYLGKYLLYRKM